MSKIDITMIKRPRRLAAIMASIKIKQYYDKNLSIDYPKLLVEQYTRTCQAINSQKYVSECLTTIEMYPEKKVELIIKLLEHLIKYPIVLLLNSRFREVLIGKLDEFELYISHYRELKKKIADLSQTVHYCITTINVREEVISHLNAIDHISSTYRKENNIMRYDELDSTIQNMRSKLKEISFHPDYTSK